MNRRSEGPWKRIKRRCGCMRWSRGQPRADKEETKGCIAAPKHRTGTVICDHYLLCASNSMQIARLHIPYPPPCGITSPLPPRLSRQCERAAGQGRDHRRQDAWRGTACPALPPPGSAPAWPSALPTASSATSSITRLVNGSSSLTVLWREHTSVPFQG